MCTTSGFRMKAVKSVLFVLAVFVSVSSGAAAQDAVIINLEIAENPWADVRLDNKLDFYLATAARSPIIRINGDMRDSLGWNSRTPAIDDLIDQAERLNARYLVDIFIDRIDIEKRKVTVIPQAAFRYRVFGVITGVMRVMDISRARVVRVEEINYEIKASDRWRFGDDDIHDADLHISAYDKTLLFDELEEKAARGIFREITRLTRGTGSFVKDDEGF